MSRTNNLCGFSMRKSFNKSQAFRFPHKIQATAIIYFKRFYLQWSIMEHHPKNIILTCMYASCKIEENHVLAEKIGKGIQQDRQVILNNEMLVFQSLGFDLIVYAPYRSIEGFIDDIEDFCQIKEEEQQMLKDLQETAYLEVDKMMVTDAPLLSLPGQLALAALHKSNAVHGLLDFESIFKKSCKFLDGITSRQQSMHTISEFIEFLDQIDYLVRQLHIPSAEDMKHIDWKLKFCLDPRSRDDKKREKRSKHKVQKNQ